MNKLEAITNVISQHFGTTEQSVRGKTRLSHVVKARHLICYFAYEELGMTLKAIATYLGHRDHTTVIHSKNTVKNSLQTFDYLFRDYKELEPSVKKIAYQGQVNIVMCLPSGVDIEQMLSDIKTRHEGVKFSVL